VSDIILADEPTGSLDEANAQKIMQLLTDLWKETHCTIVMITHSQEIADYAQVSYRLKDKKLLKD
jgi:putative ABC transport system ATP-binding protein